MVSYDKEDYVLLPASAEFGIPMYVHKSLSEKFSIGGLEKIFEEGLIVDKDDFLTEEALPMIVKDTFLDPIFRFITNLGMTNRLNFKTSYGIRIGLLRLLGYKSSTFEELCQDANYFLPGAHEFISYFQDMPKIMLSGGVKEDALATAAMMGIEIVIANDAGIDEYGRLTQKPKAYVNGNKGEITKTLGKYFKFLYGGGDSGTDKGIADSVDIFIAGPRAKGCLLEHIKDRKHIIAVPYDKPLDYALEKIREMKKSL